MTNTRIPAAPKDVGRLSLVLASAIAATKGQPNGLSLRTVKSAVVILVDGLGVHNLEDFAGHAPNLMRVWKTNPKSLRSECPSTTVLGLVTLATGLRAGSHGLIGYNVVDKGDSVSTNLLSGWEQTKSNPADWKSYNTFSEGHDITVVSPALYERSGFTKLTMPTARFVGEDDLANRLVRAAGLSKTAGAVIYVYVPELDQAGHRFGCASDAWIAQLEALDSAYANAGFASSTGVIVTADHGMVDIEPTNHVYLEQLDSLKGASFITAGDTRCAYIYLRDSSSTEKLQHALSTELGTTAYVCTWPELVESGWQGTPATDRAIPDLVLLAKDAIAFYDRRTAKPSSMRMIGHHGSLTDRETRIPLITAGF